MAVYDRFIPGGQSNLSEVQFYPAASYTGDGIPSLYIALWIYLKRYLPVRQKIFCEAYMNYTYILKCSDGTYYTGWTNDLDRRMKAHNEGNGGKYTRSRRPVELIYYESFETKREAMSREFAIKQLTRCQKEQLIQEKGRISDASAAADLQMKDCEREDSI